MIDQIKKYRLSLLPGINSATGEAYLEESMVFAGLTGYDFQFTKGDVAGLYIATLYGPHKETFPEFSVERNLGTYFHVTPLVEPSLWKGLLKDVEGYFLERAVRLFAKPAFGYR
jgi:hypothetical protein